MKKSNVKLVIGYPHSGTREVNGFMEDDIMEHIEKYYSVFSTLPEYLYMLEEMEEKGYPRDYVGLNGGEAYISADYITILE